MTDPLRLLASTDEMRRRDGASDTGERIVATIGDRIGDGIAAAGTGGTGSETGEPDCYDVARVLLGRVFRAALPGRHEGLPAAMADLRIGAQELARASSAEEDDALLRRTGASYPPGADWLVSHSANVGIAAVKIAGELGADDDELVEICIAGLVHDIGACRLPGRPGEALCPEDLFEAGRLSELALNSVAVLAGSGEYRKIAGIVEHVYERSDGSGCPQGLRGDQIDAPARIVAVADAFDLHVHTGGDRDRSGTSADGIRKLMRRSRQFDRNALKALICAVGLFPIDSLVKLNSGEIARVDLTRKDNPMRPQVTVVIDGDGRARPPTHARPRPVSQHPHRPPAYGSRARPSRSHDHSGRVEDRALGGSR